MKLHSLLIAVLCVAATPARGQDGNWPAWGGRLGDNHALEKGLPVDWDAASVAWKVPLEGVGQSVPVIWGDRIFLTSALAEGRQRVVMALDRSSGQTLWKHTAWEGEPEESHVMNGWASASCATDGEIMVAFFGKGGLHAYTVDGEPLWSRDLGRFPGPWGTAASPIINEDLVIQNCDNDAEGFLLAVDKETGKDAWRTVREIMRGWSTPILVQTPRGVELVLNGHSAIRGYDPRTGRELWHCTSFNGRGEPVPARAGDHLCVVNGLQGDVYAVRPGGSGDVTATHMVWHTPRKTDRDLPSPIVVNGYLLVIDRKGVLTGYEAATGRELWKNRIGGAFSASPVATPEGLVYFVDEAGVTAVVEPGDELIVHAKNRLNPSDEEIFRAAPTPCRGQFFLRSTTALYCIGPASQNQPERAAGN